MPADVGGKVTASAVRPQVLAISLPHRNDLVCRVLPKENRYQPLSATLQWAGPVSNPEAPCGDIPILDCKSVPLASRGLARAIRRPQNGAIAVGGDAIIVYDQYYRS
jgi:hypothetical protein